MTDTETFYNFDISQMVSTPIGPVIPPDISQMSKPPLSPNNQAYFPSINPVPLPIIPNSTAPLMQPTLQPGMPYMPNLFVPTGPQHTFPVLYNQQPVVPATTPPTEVQPMSLYAEYMGNPYNVTPAENFKSLEREKQVTHQNPDAQQRVDELEQITVSETCQTSKVNDNDIGKTVRMRVDNNNPDFEGATNNNGVTASYFQSSNYFSSQIGKSSIPPGSEILYGTQGLKSSDGIYTNSGSKISDI